MAFRGSGQPAACAFLVDPLTTRPQPRAEVTFLYHGVTPGVLLFLFPTDSLIAHGVEGPHHKGAASARVTLRKVGFELVTIVNHSLAALRHNHQTTTVRVSLPPPPAPLPKAGAERLAGRRLARDG